MDYINNRSKICCLALAGVAQLFGTLPIHQRVRVHTQVVGLIPSQNVCQRQPINVFPSYLSLIPFIIHSP